MNFAAKYRELTLEPDPLLPFDKKFQHTVQSLEQPHLQSFSNLVFRTRSPLIILLAPVFRRIQDRLHIVIGIEALNDPLHKQLESSLSIFGMPRPSERLSAARTLHELGFSVEIRLQPYVGANFSGTGLPKRAMEVFANICDSAAQSVSLAPMLGENSNEGMNYLFEQVLSKNLKTARLCIADHISSIAA